ncbi:MAG: hypothetical protein U0790_23340 [Isosphaeraceae bacterium]
MRVSFACPSCDARGSVDSVHVGKPVRCKRCGADFAIPNPAGEEPDVYALEEPAEPARWASPGADPGAVFVPSRSDERRGDGRPARPKRTPDAPTPRREASEFPWGRGLTRAAIGLVVTLGLIILLAPHGTWLAGCILLVIGSLMVIAGYAAGAYGAFQEDLLYGLLYLTIPFYTAYYMVTRWDDLWIWLTGSTIGVVLVLLGTELIRWAGAPV